jgi:tetrahydromethanopterin S-methyltransferase subunit G
MTTTERISRLEGAYEQVDRRLDDMSRAIDSLRDEMNRRINNLYLLIFGSWVTIMVAIIGLYVKG